MNSFIHLLTASAILVHATIGCCSAQSGHETQGDHVTLDSEHHNHALGIDHSEELNLVSHHCHEHGEHSDPAAPHECCKSKCKWPAPKVRNSVDVQLLNFVIEHQQHVEAIESLLLSESCKFGSPSESLQLALPVRSHLANCVLLI